MLQFLNRIIGYGVNTRDDFYEVNLKRAINILALNGIVCLFGAGLFGVLVNHDLDSYFLFLGIPIYLFVIFLNGHEKMHLGITILFMLGASLLTIFSLRAGEESYMHALFVLNIVGLAVLYRKGKIRRYYFVNMLFTFLCLGFVLLSFHQGWFEDFRDRTTEYTSERRLVLFFLIICSLVFSIVVVTSFSKQFIRLKKSADDKEVLLAELNHRVKNNLTIIVSLLRLKRDLSSNEETKEALLDIGNRIHSMALVHGHMYNGKGHSYIDVKSYFNDLLEGICATSTIASNVSCAKNITNVRLDISTAIPVGMIINELVMNSLKYAFVDNENPKAEIDFTIDGNQHVLRFRDNGPGVDLESIDSSKSLGIEIIHSLTDQLDGKCVFRNKNGLEFELKFPVRN